MSEWKRCQNFPMSGLVGSGRCFDGNDSWDVGERKCSHCGNINAKKIGNFVVFISAFCLKSNFPYSEYIMIGRHIAYLNQRILLCRHLKSG